MPLFALALALLGGCSNPPDSGIDDTATTEPDDGKLTFLTYNAGLADGFVPGAESRIPLVAAAISESDAEIVCLQEVWTPEQVAAVDMGAADRFPHRAWPDALQAADVGCQDGEIDEMVDCLVDACDVTCVDEVVDCAFLSCALPFLGLPPDCMRCAFAHVGVDPVVAKDTCVDDPVEFAYGGSYGTGILSKYPIIQTDQITFDSTTNRRGATHAVIDAPDGPVDVYCTHLTAVFAVIPYPRDTGSWAEEQLLQFDGLLDWMGTVAQTPHQALLGDLNSGPDGDGVTAQDPDGYDLLVADGFDVPYVDLDGRCTFCNDNPLIGGDDPEDNALIDHVMLKGFTDYSATRAIDGTVSADSCAVDLSVSAVSDHYGVSVTAALQ